MPSNGPQGKYKEADVFCERSLAIRETVLGPKHPSIPNSLNDLAELRRAQARKGNAQLTSSCRCLVSGQQRHGLPGRPLTSNFRTVPSQGLYKEADELYLRCIDIGEKSLGRDHPFMATMINNRAGVLVDQVRVAITTYRHRACRRAIGSLMLFSGMH